MVEVRAEVKAVLDKRSKGQHTEVEAAEGGCGFRQGVELDEVWVRNLTGIFQLLARG